MRECICMTKGNACGGGFCHPSCEVCNPELTPEGFLLARCNDTEKVIDEWARYLAGPYLDGFRAHIQFTRDVIEWHENFPVLMETAPEFGLDYGPNEAGYMTMTMSKHVEWLTQQEYVKKFGRRPPTAPLIRKMLERYKDHPHFQEEWLGQWTTD